MVMAAGTNPFLSKVMRLHRAGRVALSGDDPWYVRFEDIPGGTFAQVWFLTRGCTWDRAGACTMCDYGQSSHVPASMMVDSVAAALSHIGRPVTELFVSPSGSMFDPNEVPPEARRQIYELMRQSPSERVAIETRPDTVTTALVAELGRSFPGRPTVVGLGLESSSDWVLRFCINKMSDASRFKAAAQVVHEEGGLVNANVSLGPAFLSEDEAIADARSSALWALEHGADEVVVFPMHAKPFTLLGRLWQQGRHRPISLWALVELLQSIPPAQLSRVSVAWFREYDGCCPPGAHPTSCSDCREEVLDLLDGYRRAPSTSALEPLAAFDCSCRRERSKRANESHPKPIQARVLDEYETLAREFGLGGWFALERPHLEDAMARTRGLPRLLTRTGSLHS